MDLNCGCPKPFSTHSGSGSALLENQDTLISILEALKANLSIPVTAKIRLLVPKDGASSIERTVALLKRIEATKVAAIGIHCRFAHEKPRNTGHLDLFDELIAPLSVPVIANGDLYSIEDTRKLKESTGTLASSFMFARGAQANVSIFRKEGLLDYREIMIEYLKLAVKYDMPYHNAKYSILKFDVPEPERIPFQTAITACKTLESLWYFVLTQ